MQRSPFLRGPFKTLLKAARKADDTFPDAIRFHDLRHTAAKLDGLLRRARPPDEYTVSPFSAADDEKTLVFKGETE